MILTAHHTYATENLPAHKDPRVSEMIYTGGLHGAVYLQVSGKWKRSGMSPEDSLKQKEENIRNTKASCRYLRDEAVNGEAAAVYSIQTENEDSKSTGTVWIGKSKGMPLREEMDSDSTMHVAVRYDYSNVRPPM